MNIQKILLRIALFIQVGMYTACSDNGQGAQNLPDTPHICFNGEVQKTTATRAADGDKEENTGDPISSENDYGEIHIHAFVEEAGEDAGFLTDGTYVTHKGGTSGTLEAKKDEEKLAWFNTTASHYFHAWTTPKGVTMDKDANTTEGTVSFVPVDEDHENHTEINRKNNIDLERFIATQKGPVSYRTNGSYVALNLRHLVSKITITGVERTKRDNGTEWLDPVKITFPDMPQTATFHTGVSEDGHTGQPEVTANADGKKGLSFNAVSHMGENNGEILRYPFYLPPFKFAECGEFIVEGYHEGGYCGPYYGHLANIQGLSELGELKAGEHIELFLKVKDGKVFGVSSTILGWNDNLNKNSGHSPKHKGIYNADDLRRLYDYCKALEKGENPDETMIENLYSVKKDENGNEIKVIRLYNDINLKDYNLYMAWIPWWTMHNFIFDGMGHNIVSHSDPFFVTDSKPDNIKNFYQDGEKYQ